jgi:hypothetical protein
MKSTIATTAAAAIAAASIFATGPAAARPHITFISTPASPLSGQSFKLQGSGGTKRYSIPTIRVRFTGVSQPRVVNDTLTFIPRLGLTIVPGHVRTVRVTFGFTGIEDPHTPLGPLVFAPGSLIKNPVTGKQVSKFAPRWWAFRINARTLVSAGFVDPVAECRQRGARDGGPSFGPVDATITVSFIVLARDHRNRLQKKIRRTTHAINIQCDPSEFRQGTVAGGTRTTPKKPNPEGKVLSARAVVLNNGTRRCPTTAHLRLTVKTFNLGTVWYRVRRRSDNHVFRPGRLTQAHAQAHGNRRFTLVHTITSEVKRTHKDAYRVEVLKRAYDARAGRHRYSVLATSKWTRARIFCTQGGPQLGTPGRQDRPGFRNRG